MSSLSRYYRKPSLFVTIPSKGQYVNLNDDEKSMLGEIGIKPMTMLNQLTVNNPESLLNGDAIEQLIKDCTTITSVEPRHMFKCDIDSLLVAIRSVSLDKTMDIEVPCPSCQNKTTFQIDLSYFLENQTHHDHLPYPLDIDMEGETITLQILPSTLEQTLNIDQTFLKDAREIDELRRKLEKEMIEDGEDDDLVSAREHVMNTTNMIYTLQQNMTMRTIELYSDSIVYAETPDGICNDRDEIKDFVKQMSTKDHDRLKKKIAEINKIGIDRNYSFECPTCKHAFSEQIELNPTDFFGNGSR